MRYKTTYMALIFFRLILRLALIGVIAYGLYLNLYQALGAFQPWLLLFYTTQSNSIILVLFIILCVYDLRALFSLLTNSQKPPSCPPEALKKLKIAFTWAISITGIVWHLLLVPEIDKHPDLAQFLTPDLLLSFSLLHTWSALLAFLDWLIFDPKKPLSKGTPFAWLLIPFIYFVFICAWVNLIGPVNQEYGFYYPYPFIDFKLFDALIIWRNVACITIGALVLGYLYLAINTFCVKISHTISIFTSKKSLSSNA